MKINISITCD